MRKQSQEIFTHVGGNPPEGWAAAIEEAELQIAAAEKKIRGLRLSIETFREMEIKGEPFPGHAKPKRRAKAA